MLSHDSPVDDDDDDVEWEDIARKSGYYAELLFEPLNNAMMEKELLITFLIGV